MTDGDVYHSDKIESTLFGFEPAPPTPRVSHCATQAYLNSYNKLTIRQVLHLLDFPDVVKNGYRLLPKASGTVMRFSLPKFLDKCSKEIVIHWIQMTDGYVFHPSDKIDSA